MNRYRKLRRLIALGLSLALTFASSSSPSIPEKGKECLSSSSIFGGLLSPGWDTPELLRAQIAVQPDLQKLNRQMGDPKNWGVAAIEDYAQSLAPEKKTALETTMKDFLQKHGERLSRTRSLDTMLAVVFDPHNWHFRKYSEAELVQLIETAMQVSLYVNQNGMRVHPGGSFGHARRGNTPNAQGQSRGPVIWLGRGLFEHPEITDHDLVLLLLEESQHIVFPDRKHGEDQEEIDHSSELVEKLKRLEGNPSTAEEFCDADLVPSEEGPLKKKLQDLRRERGNRFKHQEAVIAIAELVNGSTDERIKYQILQDLRKGVTDVLDYARSDIEVEHVVRAITGIKDEGIKCQILQDLRKQINYTNYADTSDVIYAVGEIGMSITDEEEKCQTLEDLRIGLKHDYLFVRKAAVKAVAKVVTGITDKKTKLRVLQDFRERLTDENENIDIITTSVDTMGQVAKGIKDQEIKRQVLQDLRNKLKDKDGNIRLFAAIAVGRVAKSIKDQEIKRQVLQDLRELQKDEAWQVCFTAICEMVEVVKGIRDEVIRSQVLQDLRELLKYSSLAVRRKAIKGVVKIVKDLKNENIKPQILQELREQLKDVWVWRNLIDQREAELASQGLDKVLMVDVEYADVEFAQATFDAMMDVLRSVRDQEIKQQVLQVLQKWLQDEDKNVRKFAARAIFFFGTSSDNKELKSTCYAILEPYRYDEIFVNSGWFKLEYLLSISDGEDDDDRDDKGDENWLDTDSWQDPPQSPDMLQGKEIPHAERNAHLREQIHAGHIFSIFPIPSTSSARNAAPNFSIPFASTRPLDEAV